ncbi:MAG: hypothetical protein GWO20_10690 [Candidatus Korarchaeota archaeon]|nr:hypothetical protein [Candidatus Korarchaeota archaeon]NIU83950.1 hypothetical protein [Candidatus Thorarchaeota archaeon]NIW14078.1 hypothetical protein [Candidatus Thorarchaeota archaeon]NIW52188.1 hypothetical protein [Candidatus Korarchaeota archaeon]
MDKKKRSWVEKFFDEQFRGFDSLSDQGGGYSVQVTQTPEGTVVKAQISGDMDRDKMKRQLERKYPNAKIEIEGGKSQAPVKIKKRKKLNIQKDEEEKTGREEEKKKVSLNWKDDNVQIEKKDE